MALSLVVHIQNPVRRASARAISSVTLRLDMMLSWLPAAVLESMGVGTFKTLELRRPNGEVFERRSGAVIATIQGRSTIDEVVFAEPTDGICIGWHTLSGLNLRFDPTSRQLVDGGPIPAAAFSSPGIRDRFGFIGRSP